MPFTSFSSQGFRLFRALSSGDPVTAVSIGRCISIVTPLVAAQLLYHTKAGTATYFFGIPQIRPVFCQSCRQPHSGGSFRTSGGHIEPEEHQRLLRPPHFCGFGMDAFFVFLLAGCCSPDSSAAAAFSVLLETTRNPTAALSICRASLS